MANQNMRRILSGFTIALWMVLFCTPHVSLAGFTGERLKFTISGSVGLPNVTMKGLPDGVVVTDENGYYSATVEWGWGGEVTPVREGYIFEPASRIYSQVTSNQGNQNYTATLKTYTISGTTGIPGVTLTNLPGNVVSDAQGVYTATVSYNFSGVVTPVKEGYQFTPQNRMYENVRQDQANHNYTAEVIKFTISGTTGVDGVLMKGLPGDPVTSGAGTYTATVEWNWSGTVTPMREGYLFDPPQREYPAVVSIQANQNYTATPLTYAISGTTGIAGVLMKGLPENPITDSSGNYRATVKHGWGGAVTPVKEGYTFEPSTRSYTKVTEDQANQGYTPTVITLTISGSTGIGGVTMGGLPGDPVTDANGYYTASVNYNWTGTVTPIKEGHTFTPVNRSYDQVRQNQAGQDYTGQLITFQISGTVGVANAVMDGLPNNPVTGSDGSYVATVKYGWSGTVTPKRAGYSFEPASRQYPAITSAQTNQNYQAELQTHVISGIVNSERGPIEGVVISADSGGGTAVTGTDGRYELDLNYGWSGTVTPTLPGHTFNPPSRRYDPLTTDQTTQGYTGELIMLAISGTIRVGGEPIEGVRVSASEGGTSDVTDANGKYQIQVPYGWTGKVTPEKEGYVFNPPSKDYANVTQSIKDDEPVGPPVDTTRIGPPPVDTTRVGPPPVDTTRIGPPPVDSTRVGPPPSDANQADIERAKLEAELAKLRAQIEDLINQMTPGQAPPEGPGRIVVGPDIPPTRVIDQNFPPPQIGPRPFVKPSGPLVSAVFYNTDLVEALQKLAAQSGVDIHTDGTVKGKVTISLVNVPLEQALTSLLQGTGYAFKEVPDSYLVYTPISNIYQDNDLRMTLQDIATLAKVVIIPDESVQGLVTCTLENVPLDTALEMVLAGTGYAVKKTPYYYLISSPDPTSPGFPEISETRRVKMNYIDADKAVLLLSTAFQRYAKAETDTHSVCITAPSSLADRIVADLKKVDQPTRHVMLDARIVVMERGDLLNLGIEWGWPKIQAGFFGESDLHGGRKTYDADASARPIAPRAEWPWGVQIGYTAGGLFTDALLLNINLLAENGEADIVANPQTIAQDGKVSRIDVMTEEYYMMTAPEISLYYTRAELKEISSGTMLEITPRIGDNNEISLDVAVEVSDSIPRGRGSDLPVVTRRKATNTVRIRDGGTVALAGLSESRRRVKGKRVPGLSNIPIVGALFKNTDSDKSTREIAVFITAYLIQEGQQPTVEFVESPTERPLTEIQPRPTGQELFQRSLRESLAQPTRQPPPPSEAAEDQFERLLRESLAQPIR